MRRRPSLSLVAGGAFLAAAACGARTGLPVESRAKLASAECRPDGRDAAPPTVDLLGTLRDFHGTHPDFESFIGDDRGIVLPTLGPDDKPVYAGQTDNPSTHGAEAFDPWYHDAPGINLSTQGDITLSQLGWSEPDVYGFSDDEFFPLDGRLFGNEGRPHNYHFTLELHASFEYLGGEVVSFTGDDDVWVFVNRELAIDLGGVHAQETAEIDLDDAAGPLHLTRGQIATFDLFFAERHTEASTFAIEMRWFVVCAPTGS